MPNAVLPPCGEMKELYGQFTIVSPTLTVH